MCKNSHRTFVVSSTSCYNENSKRRGAALDHGRRFANMVATRLQEQRGIFQRGTGRIVQREGAPLQKSGNNTSLEQVVRQTWLHYFNNYLYERGIITEVEWRKMHYLIER